MGRDLEHMFSKGAALFGIIRYRRNGKQELFSLTRLRTTDGKTFRQSGLFWQLQTSKTPNMCIRKSGYPCKRCKRASFLCSVHIVSLFPLQSK